MALFFATVPLARAQAPTELYQCTTVVTGTDMRSRPTGFARCLREVLVKVSGEPRLAADARVAESAAHADQLVLSFSYADQMAGIPHHDDQGTYDRSYDLAVKFDPARVDPVLAKLGEQVWRGERPVVVPVIVVRGFAPPWTRTWVLTAEEPAAADQRGALANSGVKYGVKVRIPTSGEFAAWRVTTDGFPSPGTASDQDQALVAGTLEFRPAALGWVGSWRLRWRDADYTWGVRGVGFDAAFDDLVRGATRIASGHGGPE